MHTRKHAFCRQSNLMDLVNCESQTLLWWVEGLAHRTTHQKLGSTVRYCTAMIDRCAMCDGGKNPLCQPSPLPSTHPSSTL